MLMTVRKNGRSPLYTREMLKLEIVTPEKRVVDAEVDFVTVPTASGEAGIFPNHAPLISALRPGIISYAVRGTSEKLVVSGGFVEVNAEKVSVLADSAESAEDIDPTDAKTSRDEAERLMTGGGATTAEAAEIARESVDLANARLQIATPR